MSGARRHERGHGGAGERRRRTTPALAMLVALAFALVAPSVPAQVLLVLSDESTGYQGVADEMRTTLKGVRDGRLRIDTVVAARLGGADAPKLDAYELAVTVGLAAAQTTLAREEGLAAPPRTLCLLIPRQSFEHLPKQANANGRVSAVYIDQPLARQLDLLRLALPDRQRVGVILGPSSQELAGALQDASRAHALELTTARIDDAAKLYGALQAILPASDLLLMLPDPIATNADSVYGLLLTAYRAAVPVVGFSEGLLNAGALMSLYSTARQQGRQGAELAAAALARGGALPAPEYPRYFTVRTNASVARSLGVRLPSAEELTQQLSSRNANDAKPGPTDGAAKPGGNP